MKVPDRVQSLIKQRLWALADGLNWACMSNSEKSRAFEGWMRDAEVGGLLSRYLEPGSVRVYLKDSVMKPYARERTKEFRPVANLLGLSESSGVAECYVKPHGRRMGDGKVICWGLSRDWKAVLFAVFERAYAVPSAIPFAAVILLPTGKCQQPAYRGMIGTAAARLGIQRLEWYDQ